MYAVLGATEAAFAALRAAESIRCLWFFQMLGDLRIAPLKERPEFADLRAIFAAMARAR